MAILAAPLWGANWGDTCGISRTTTPGLSGSTCAMALSISYLRDVVLPFVT